jgi:regulatory protein
MATSRRVEPIESTRIPGGYVTAIQGSQRGVGRFDLLIDGQPSARLSIDAIERLGLRVGMVVDEQMAARIGAEADLTRAYDRAMTMLAMRGRASGELRRLMMQKGEPRLVAEAAIARLQQMGFVDDAAFSRHFVRFRASAGWSRRRIDRELGRRGVDRSTVADAIGEVFADEGFDDRTTIHREAEKKLRSLRNADAKTRRRRLYGFLARRGYDPDAIGEVLRQMAPDGE